MIVSGKNEMKLFLSEHSKFIFSSLINRALDSRCGKPSVIIKTYYRAFHGYIVHKSKSFEVVRIECLKKSSSAKKCAHILKHIILPCTNYERTYY